VARQIVLLRGINLGSRNRIAMPELRAVFEETGYDDVRTYLQSGNIVLSSTALAAKVARESERLIANAFGLEIAAVVRTRKQLAEVVRRNPLAKVAEDPKRYQVSFLEKKPSAALVGKLESAAAESERLVAIGSELYAWHPAGVARSRLWAMLAGRDLGVKATARNWTTVTKLLELAGSE
jgi:uncharacterized protein (DUF1697 family)